jgi:hypothetical protein
MSCSMSCAAAENRFCPCRTKAGVACCAGSVCGSGISAEAEEWRASRKIATQNLRCDDLRACAYEVLEPGWWADV